MREVVNELQVIDTSSIKDITKDLAASATLRGKMIADKDISSLNFSIDVVNGIVYLSGVASTPVEMSKLSAMRKSSVCARSGELHYSCRETLLMTARTLSFAIQMDPVASIDIAADSTFALGLEAQSRSHDL